MPRTRTWLCPTPSQHGDSGVLATTKLNVRYTTPRLRRGQAVRVPQVLMQSNRRVLASTSLGAFLSPFASSVISFSVPELGHSLQASYVSMVWVPMAYLIPLPSSMILFGKLSDAFGRPRFYSLGLFIFGASALLATFSNSVYFLIITALCMGIGGSLLSVNSTAIVSSVYPPESRGGALGVNAMSVYLGLTTGPILSGLLLGLAGWQSLFYFIGLMSLVSLVPAHAFVRNVATRKRPAPLDLAGFVVFLSSILLIVLYLALVDMYGWLHPAPIFVAGLSLLVLFAALERRRVDPMLDLTLFTRNRTFSAANFTAFLNYVSTFAIVFVFSIYFIVVAGLSPAESGFILTAEPVLMVIVSPISGRLSDRLGSRSLASLGMLVIAASFFYLSASVGRVAPVDLAWPLATLGVGFGLFSAPNTNSVMGSVGKEDFGTASGTLGTMRFVGQLMSIAVMSTLLAASMPGGMLLQLFSGIGSNLSLADVSSFLAGLREAMLLSGSLSFVGVFTSLLR